jgi:hypothetical protein
LRPRTDRVAGEAELKTVAPFCASCATLDTDETAIKTAVTIDFFITLFLVTLGISFLWRLGVQESRCLSVGRRVRADL